MSKRNYTHIKELLPTIETMVAEKAKAQRGQRSARDEGAPMPRTFAGHRNRKQVDTHDKLV